MRIIAGVRRGMKIAAPPGRDTRPVLDRVKQSWFDVLGPRTEAARVLDVYAGVGSLGLEALSRGASRCLFVERAPECVALLRAHVERSGFASRSVVREADAAAELAALASAREEFDLVFLDPPFATARESHFAATGGIMDLAARLLSREGMLTLRREHVRPKGRTEGAPPEERFPSAVRLADRRRWGRNEVLFLERKGGEQTPRVDPVPC